MATYVCRSCGFKKEVKAEVPKKCPYCSKPGALKREENAEELLDEE